MTSRAEGPTARTAHSQAIQILVCLLLSACTVGAPGADSNGRGPPGKIDEEMVFSHPPKPPTWAFAGVLRTGEDSLTFTGVSRRYSTEQESRMNALRDAREQIASYLITDVKHEIHRVSLVAGSSTDILNPGTVQEEVARLLSATTLLGTAGTQYYVQKWLRRENGTEQVYWKTYALVAFPEQQNKEIRNALMKNAAQRQLDRLEKLQLRGGTGGTKIRDFEKRMASVQQAMQQGKHVEAIAQAQALLDRATPAEAAARRQAAKPARPRKLPFGTPREVWMASYENDPKKLLERGQVRRGIHALHVAAELLADNEYSRARQVLTKARLEAQEGSRQFSSSDLAYQAKLFDSLLRDMPEQKPGTQDAQLNQKLQRMLDSHWRAVVSDNTCPHCGIKHVLR